MNIHPTSLQKTGYILDLISQKQNIISTNIANVDTPGYLRKDLNFSQYLNDISIFEPAISKQMGIGVVAKDEGGSVDLVNELAEMQKNAILYQVATRRMSSVITELKSVVNVGR